MGQSLSSHNLPLTQRSSTEYEKDPRATQVVPTGAAGGRKGSWWRSHQGRLHGEDGSRDLRQHSDVAKERKQLPPIK